MEETLQTHQLAADLAEEPKLLAVAVRLQSRRHLEELVPTLQASFPPFSDPSSHCVATVLDPIPVGDDGGGASHGRQDGVDGTQPHKAPPIEGTNSRQLFERSLLLLSFNSIQCKCKCDGDGDAINGELHKQQIMTNALL